MRLVLFPMVVVCLLFVMTISGQVVNENLTEVIVTNSGSTVKLVVDSPAAMSTIAKVDFVAPNGSVDATQSASRQLVVGRNEVELSAPTQLIATNKEFPFYTLKYDVGGKRGSIAVSRVAPHLFDLEAFGFRDIQPGSRYRTRVRAVHPILLRGVAGVEISGVLEIEFDNGTTGRYAASAVTGADGITDLSFQLPANSKVDDAELNLTGSKLGLRRELEVDVDEHSLTDYSFVYFQTDKPIYQPSQMLNVRTLFFDWHGKPIINEPLVFTIKDPEGTILQKVDARTSRFGIASIAWAIPDSARLGEYSVTVSGSRRLSGEERKFKVSRYDLPNFSVSAKTDRDYYMPNQDSASVTVRADYLFGKPVTTARVRVVEETDRDWNFALQKYETKEGQVREGELAADGTFAASFDLTKHHEDFDSSEKFEDIHFAAYVTDLTTNKTEQKRFDIRITKEPVHIYITGVESDMSRRLPGRFYVTTFYPDGSPAECDVSIYQADEDDEDKPGKRLLKTKTNRLGGTRVLLPLNFLPEEEEDLDLVLVADDRHGHKGRLSKDLDFDPLKPAVRITTDKLIYRKGEPIRVAVTSSQPEGDLFLDVTRRGQVLSSHHLTTKGGRAAIEIPFTGEFRNDITLAAYGSFGNSYGGAETYYDNKTVLYPKPTDFFIDATTDGETFRPGEEATLKLAARNAAGNGEEAAFGVAVIDKAIEERARTDTEFGTGYRSFYSDLEDYLGLSIGQFGLVGNTIENMDTTRALLPEVELAIEIALIRRVVPDLDRSPRFESELNSAYTNYFATQFTPIRNILTREFYEKGSTAVDSTSLQALLARNGIDLKAMRDPWGNEFSADVLKMDSNAEVRISSAGADEKFDTADDAVVFSQRYQYFYPTGTLINRAFYSYLSRTGEYIRDYTTLRDEVRRTGTDLEKLRDAWGEKYKFDFSVEGAYLVLNVRSGGWDKKFGGSNDFSIWRNYSDYFQVMRANMAGAFRRYIDAGGKFPADESEFRRVMRECGFDLEKLKDIYRRDHYVSREVGLNRVGRRFVAKQGYASAVIASRDVVAYVIRSAGADGVRGNTDDYGLTQFAGVVDNPKTTSKTKGVASLGNRGAISGEVTDPNGAVIPGATVILQCANKRDVHKWTDQDGHFEFVDLLPSACRIRVEASGFKALVFDGLLVQGQAISDVYLTLEVGEVSNVVDVVASSEIDQTTNTTGSNITTEFFSNLPTSRTIQGLYTIAPTVARSGLRDVSGRDRDPSVAGSSGPENSYILDGETKGDSSRSRPKQDIETPRLREYFPETLLWLPELVSQANGTAELRIKLADSITKWKIQVIGSTADGNVAIAEKEITAFQPFFVDLDPPKFLTEGDNISLPVQIRNYTNDKQSVNVSMASGDWFTLAGADKQTIEVNAGATQNAVFPFRADRVVTGGKQRVTAIANTDSDAIEKPVTVRPDGQEITRSQSKLFTGTETFRIDFPANAIAGTQRAEAKIYPNLFAHVTESVEGLLRRPYGCGEQTISSTYPNLMILKFVKRDNALRRTAQKYLQKGYERLLGYQVADGGFAYWGGSEQSDVALTVYALRFLNDAKEFVAVDENVIKRTEEFLIKRQAADGGWSNNYRSTPSGSLLDTVYVARSLAMRKSGGENAPLSAAMQKAFAFIDSRQRSITDPYVLALAGLARLDAGDAAGARAIAERLRTSAVKDGDSVYWDLESSTPFNGWGRTGRIESTALAVQLLTRVFGENAASGGTLYLLRNKDRYGVWYSTQTTVNVLDAFLATLSSKPDTPSRSVQVFLNGAELATVRVDPDAVEPFMVDLNGRLNPVENVLEIRTTSPLMAQTVATHYVSWADAPPVSQPDLRLDHRCDKTEAAIMTEITCTVQIGRVGTRGGYGMLLAEIGLPPGADVSRETLERVVKDDWSMSRYEVLPDRIIFYLWTKPGGTQFNFTFRPRYGIDAKTPASIVYDYYNPEAQAVQSPMRFVIQ